MESNRDLSRRLASLQYCFDTSSILDRPQSVARSQLHLKDNGSFQSFVVPVDGQEVENSSTATVTSSTQHFEFESDLKSSRPYRKARRDSVDYSFRSSIALSHAWTALSDISLSDISIIATVGLPIYSSNITNAHHYRFGLVTSKLSANKAKFTSSDPDDYLGGHRLMLRKPAKARFDSTTHGAIPKAALPKTRELFPKLRRSLSLPIEYKIVVVGSPGVVTSRLRVHVSHSQRPLSDMYLGSVLTIVYSQFYRISSRSTTLPSINQISRGV